MKRLSLLAVAKSLRVILDNKDTAEAVRGATEVLDCVIVEAYEKHDSDGNVK